MKKFTHNGQSHAFLISKIAYLGVIGRIDQNVLADILSLGATCSTHECSEGHGWPKAVFAAAPLVADCASNLSNL